MSITVYSIRSIPTENNGRLFPVQAVVRMRMPERGVAGVIGFCAGNSSA